MRTVESLIEAGYMVEDAKGETSRVKNAIKRLSEVTTWGGFQKEIKTLINPSTYNTFPREECLEALKSAQANMNDLNEEQKTIVSEVIRLYNDIGILTSQIKAVVSIY